MIQPYVDLTGRMTRGQVVQRDQQSMIEELARLSDQAVLLSSMEIAAYGNVDNTPISSNRPIPANVATIPHNLGYVPLFLVYKSNAQSVGTNYTRLPVYFQSVFDLFINPGKITYQLVAWADTQNLYIDILQGTAGLYSDLLAFRYYIFKQPNS